MKSWLFLLALLGLALCSLASNETPPAAGKLWVATGDPHEWQIARLETRHGKQIWLATDNQPGSREELEEVSRNNGVLNLKSLTNPNVIGQLSDDEYRAFYQDHRFFRRKGRWVQ